MGKYFGTDGVRGVANRELTPELAFRLGRCGGYVLAGGNGTEFGAGACGKRRPTVVIGRDTRVSGPMLEAAIVAGLSSIGVDVVRLGVVTTPGVAFLTKALGADAGVMISASHNPVGDNGIKFFGPDGFKLSDETELAIERLLDEPVDALPRPEGGSIGVVRDDAEAKRRYADYLKSTVDVRFDGLKIALDCANGAAYELAPRLFRELGAEVVVSAAEPDGLNINAGCGSTHIAHLKRVVLESGADFGLAFDGDADRLIAVDGTGEEVDGDALLLMLAIELRRCGKLVNDTIVATVMSNFGFFKAAESLGFRTVQTAVGDRYVMEEMRRGGYSLGGEQSGHIILLDYATTGDGLLTALQVVRTVVRSGKPLSELRSVMRKYPQVLVNVRVRDKNRLYENAAVEEAIRAAERELVGRGRVLVRPSGTESLVRIMAEGPDEGEVRRIAGCLAKVIERELA